MTILIIINMLFIIILLAFGVYGWYYYRSHMKKLGKNGSDAWKEFEKAMRQAEKYSDKKGWISIEWVNRDDYADVGIKRR